MREKRDVEGNREGGKEERPDPAPPRKNEDGPAETPEEATDEVHLRSTFEHSVAEGVARLNRSGWGLMATGAVGGIDVSLGVLALMVVQEATGSPMLGALAFTIGFIALTLGKSELFTENFLVPVAAIVAEKASVRSLLRLWIGTAVSNLVAGWLFALLFILALPRLEGTAVEIASWYPELGAGRAFALAVIAGVVITFMTWMEQGAKSEFGRIVAVSAAAFLLAAVPLNHVIVVSLEMFAALHTGAAPFGYVEWLWVAALATAGNALGGLLLVTVLRFIQVGPEEIMAARRSWEPPERRQG